MEIILQINKWLKELLYRTDDIYEHFKFEVQDRKNKHKIIFFTKNNKYQIVASGLDKTYLGCQVSSRKPRAGEDWTRGNDLPDGKFNKETWIRIKNAIISYELVKMAKKQIEMFDEVEIKENE